MVCGENKGNKKLSYSSNFLEGLLAYQSHDSAKKTKVLSSPQ